MLSGLVILNVNKFPGGIPAYFSILHDQMDPTRRTEIHGRIAYDAELQHIRVLEDIESPAEPSEFYGRYHYFKEVH